MGRVRARPLLVLALLALSHRGVEAAPEPERYRLFADTDDDDGDGTTDGQDASPETAHDVRWLEPRERAGLTLRGILGKGARVIVGSDFFTEGSGARGPTSGRIGIQGLHAGSVKIDLGAVHVEADVCEFSAWDANGKNVDLAKSHASISRTLPPKLAKEADGAEDEDALSWRVVCPPGVSPHRVRIQSVRPDGRQLDAIEAARVERVTCPIGTNPGYECGSTDPIRATSDLIDRNHPASVDRSIRAEVGGRIVVQVEGRKASSIRVGGPRETALGSFGRYRAKLRFHVIRMSKGGSVPIGGNDEGARVAALGELRTASALWGQCGIVFGPEGALEAQVVDPPPSYLLALGCDLGLPASGGVLTFEADGRPIRVETKAGQTPVEVAHAVERALSLVGFRAAVSPNARIAQGAGRTADVLVRRTNGEFANLSAVPKQPLSNDGTLSLCLGEVDLSDGLDHFDDLDAASGTVEERTLVKAYLDDDASTIDVFVVPSFSRTGRIGESFIDADRSSIRNAVIVDRAGIRAGARSFALAHELGHILLDMPGHPDDYGVDRPSALMDADAADPTMFGPRRLSVADCERALLQSGPAASTPLLEPWPLYNVKQAP